MKQLELTDNEIYYLFRHMESLWIWEESRYAKSIRDKASVLLNEIIDNQKSQEHFKREYECQWVTNVPPTNDPPPENPGKQY